MLPLFETWWKTLRKTPEGFRVELDVYVDCEE